MVTIDTGPRDEIDRRLAELHRRRYTDPPAVQRAALALYATCLATGYERGAAAALRLSGSVHAFQSNLDAAEDQLGRAEAMFQQLGDSVGLGLTLTAMGSLCSRRGEHMRAVAHHEAALGLLRASQNRIPECDALVALGWTYNELSLYAEAFEVLVEARQIAEEEGDELCLLRALNNLACVVSSLEDRDLAEQLYQQALLLARARNQPADEAAILGNLGIHARYRGEVAIATAYVAPALKTCRRLGLRKHEAGLLMELGEIYRTAGELARAEEQLAEALAISVASGERSNMALALQRLGVVRLNRGDAKGALKWLTDALPVAEAAGLTMCVRDVHLALTQISEELGDCTAALRHHRSYHDAAMQMQAAEGKVGVQQRKVIEHLQRLKQEMEGAILRSELRVLKAQLQPHFLFNALNSIAALMHRDIATADSMLLKLGDLLRMALWQSSRQEVALADEVHFVRLYLELEQMRFGSALEVRMNIEDDLLAARIPHLLLQPLAENALKHGFNGRREGRLAICARRSGGELIELSVQDDGAGLPRGWSMESAGVGLSHTRERMRLMYGAQCSFEVIPAHPRGTLVRLRFPFSAAAQR